MLFSSDDWTNQNAAVVSVPGEGGYFPLLILYTTQDLQVLTEKVEINTPIRVISRVFYDIGQYSYISIPERVKFPPFIMGL